jgi:hypothetical protein
VAAGLADEDLVAVVFAALDGLVFQQVCGVNELPTERVVAALRALLVRACAEGEEVSGGVPLLEPPAGVVGAQEEQGREPGQE